MSSSAASLHNQRLPAEAEHSQRVPAIDSAVSAQQIKLKERQRFFEEVFQHDVDHHMYYSSSHLTIRDYRRPPIGSISSMEVNVDMLEQMELFDIPDHESLDVFFTPGAEDGMASPVPAQGNHNNNNEEVIGDGLLRHVLEGWESANYRTSSTSSSSSSGSENTNGEGGDTPVFQSDEDDEEAHASAGPHDARTTSTEREKGKQAPASS